MFFITEFDIIINNSLFFKYSDDPKTSIHKSWRMSSPLTISQFLDILLSDYRGQIVACNVLDGMSEKLYDTLLVQQLFDWWLSLCNRLGHTTPNRVLATLDNVVFGDYPGDFRTYAKKPDFLLNCRRKTRLINSHSHLTTVVSLQNFRDLIHNNDLRRLHTRGVEFPSGSYIADDSLNALINLSEDDRKVHLNSIKAIGGFHYA